MSNSVSASNRVRYAKSERSPVIVPLTESSLSNTSAGTTDPITLTAAVLIEKSRSRLVKFETAVPDL
jgi:hypothetical protein